MHLRKVRCLTYSILLPAALDSEKKTDGCISAVCGLKGQANLFLTAPYIRSSLKKSQRYLPVAAAARTFDQNDPTGLRHDGGDEPGLPVWLPNTPAADELYCV